MPIPLSILMIIIINIMDFYLSLKTVMVQTKKADGEKSW